VAVTAVGELQYHRDGQTTLLRSDAVAQGYALPSISPNGQQVVFARQTSSLLAVSVVSLVDGQLRDLYTSDTESPIAIQWSPDGRYVTFLLDGTSATVVVASDGRSPALTIAHGSPTYIDWSPDSTALLLHIGGIGRDGGVVGIYDVTTQTVVQTYNDPADFQAPQWDAQGAGFFYVADPTPQADAMLQPEAQIVHQMRDGTRTVIAQEGLATVRLLRAPKGNVLAFIASRSDERVLRVWDNGTLTTLSNAAPLAAWWSPDASQIAMITAVDDQQVRWDVVTLANQQQRTLQAFIPSDMYIGYMRYFDAYRISPWSKDGQWLLTTTTTIVQAQALDGGTMVPLGPGEFAIWVE
jgi:WD40 repeat protein